MTFTSSARVPTSKASRYLQQLCKHWSHNLAVEFNEQKGGVVFPRNARALKGAVARHIDRFAFREAPLAFNWQDTLNG